MKRILIIVGLILIVGALVWKFGFSEAGFVERFPENWVWRTNSLSRSGDADETGQFPEGTTVADDPLNITERTVSVKAVNSDGTVVIEDHYVVHDAITNSVVWEFASESVVDSVTAQFTTSDYKGDYFLLPRHAKKTTYQIRNVSYESLPLDFQHEEIISGINTYVYSFTGDSNTSEGSFDRPLEDNQSFICFDMELTYWVEPITGEVLKSREWCEGEWVVDTSTDERLYATSRWGVETSGDDLIRRSNEIQNMLDQYNWRTLYLPALLIGAGLLLIVAGFYLPVASQSQKAGLG